MQLVMTQNITLDGVVAVSEKTGDWFDPAGDDADMSDVEDTIRNVRNSSGRLGCRGGSKVCE